MRSHPSIPPHAELVFEWVRSKVFQWDQELYDGSIARFERTRFIDGAFTVPILENGNILLTEQEQPARGAFFSLPGWAIDPEDATPLDGAKRELLEEAGLVSDEWTPWIEFTGTVNTLTFVNYFVARNCRVVGAVNPDPGEKIRTFEVSFDEFLELSSDKRLQHHWNLLPELYEARLSKEKYDALKEIFYGK